MRITVRKGSADDAAALAGFRFAAEAEDGAGVDAADFAADFAAWIGSHGDTHQPFLAEVDGAALVAAVLEEARRRGVEHVTVHSSTRAVALYERAGFRHERKCLYWESAS